MEQPWYDNPFAWLWLAAIAGYTARFFVRKQMRRHAERAWHCEELAR